MCRSSPPSPTHQTDYFLLRKYHNMFFTQYDDIIKLIKHKSMTSTWLPSVRATGSPIIPLCHRQTAVTPEGINLLFIKLINSTYIEKAQRTIHWLSVSAITKKSRHINARTKSKRRNLKQINEYTSHKP